MPGRDASSRVGWRRLLEVLPLAQMQEELGRGPRQAGRVGREPVAGGAGEEEAEVGSLLGLCDAVAALAAAARGHAGRRGGVVEHVDLVANVGQQERLRIDRREAAIKPDADDRAVGGAFYDDMTGGSRSEAALHADTRACNPSGRLKDGSPRFARCMASRGWRLAFSLPVPRAPAYADGPSGGSRSRAQAQTDADNFWEAQRNEDAARQMQQSIDATNAANAAAAAAAAAAATQQNNIISQTCNYAC
jgi:hypothetical protein